MIQFLYVGRQKTLAQEIENVWQGIRAMEKDDPPLQAMRVLWVTRQGLAMDALRTQTFRAILLEVDGRRNDRTHFCQDLRRRYPALRIVGVCHEPLRPQRFEFDGLLTLPLLAAETAPLLHAVCNGGAETQMRIGPIHLDMATRTVQGPRGRYQLPPKLCNLLQILMNHAGEAVSREVIMRQVWETDFLADTRTLDVHVRWLRQKIEPDPAHPVYLLTVRGQGYQLAMC